MLTPHPPVQKAFHEASLRIAGREEAMAVLMDELEVRLELMGATAIEDKLQDGVPATLTALMSAKIKVPPPPF
jgi:magnesium-transporting ATPase (P-type)